MRKGFRLPAGLCVTGRKVERIMGLSVLLMALGLIGLQSAGARVYTVSGRDMLGEDWNYPKGTLELSRGNRLQMVYVRKRIDAAANASQFVHMDAKGKEELRGGIKTAGSNLKDAPNILDGDVNTWWKPDPKDDLQDWFIEVDLGRVVLADTIRLIFPDTLGAKPFENFTVYVSPGIQTPPGQNVFTYLLAGRTSKPNRDRVVEYEIMYRKHAIEDTTKYGEYWEEQFEYMPVQYIRIVLNSKNENAALAEIQVPAYGDNIALGTLKRGGWWVTGAGINVPTLFDGGMTDFFDMKILTDWDWKPGGAYFVWDLGATFWVDTIVFLGQPRAWAGNSPNIVSWIQGYIIKVSDGSLNPGGVSEVPEMGGRDFEQIVDVDNMAEPHRYFFMHKFPKRRVRYVFFRHAHGTGNKRSRGGGGAHIVEMPIYGEGYPAEVVLESPIIDLGEIAGDKKAKNVTAISWVADTPPGSRLVIKTTTGNSLIEEIHYYDKGGKEITKKKWERLKKYGQEGPKIVIYKPGADWSPWSRPYEDPSGSSFLSPSPRRYMKLRVKFISEAPEVTPSLSSISVHYDIPLLKAAVARIEPRRFRADQDTLFTYSISPDYGTGDRGFNQVFIEVPHPADVKTVSVGGVDKTQQCSVKMEGDSLLVVELPQIVRRKQVDVAFVCRVYDNSTIFRGYIGNSRRPGVWQRVEPAERGATTVLLPSLAKIEDLIVNFTAQPKVITPNKDGVNDQVVIRFSVVKVKKDPKVLIYNLGGEVIEEVRARRIALEGQPSWEATWDGGDNPPGVYICQIRVDAEAGNREASQAIILVK
ncbi:MAG: hypothetical protein DRQ02_05155 [Candidatus Latescibacterota bacterium]|nr:MAG: hypothetical protein DRQ02_05155 [Candidatus Latescibacterota bacterium]